MIAIEFALSHPKCKIKFGTALLTDLVEFVLPAFDTVLDDCPEAFYPKYNQIRSKFTFQNGSEIKLVGLDKKRDAMRGNVIDLIIIDEAGFTDRLLYLYKSVIIPATTHRPNCRVVMSSSTPREPEHEYFQFISKAKFEDAYICKTIHDNPMLNEQTKGRVCYEMGGKDSVEWRREYNCERIRDDQLTIIPDWSNKSVVSLTRDRFYQLHHKYVSMDLGVVRDHTAILFGYYDFPKAQLVIEDEFVIHGPQMTTNILQAHIKRKEIELYCANREFLDLNEKKLLTDSEITAIHKSWLLFQPKVYYRVSDNNNPLLLQDLQILHHINFWPVEKSRLREMVNQTRMLIRSEGLVVHPRCKQLIGSLEYGIWDERRDEFARSMVYGHFDTLAALIYMILNLNRNTNPIPADLDMDISNQIFFPHLKESATVRTIKNAFG